MEIGLPMQSGPAGPQGTSIFKRAYKDDKAVEMMTSAVEHRYDELRMEVTDDFILAGAFEHYDEGG